MWEGSEFYPIIILTIKINSQVELWASVSRHIPLFFPCLFSLFSFFIVDCEAEATYF